MRSTHAARDRRLAVAAVLLVASAALPSAQTPPIFRGSRDVVSIDVIVRDRWGAIVRGLSSDDFEIREDGRPEEVLTSTFQAIDNTAAASNETVLLQRLGSTAAAPAATAIGPSGLSGRRLMLLLFDLSSMESEEVERGVQAALKFVDAEMSNADLVAVASLTWQMSILTDFTGDRQAVRDTLRSLVAVDASTGDAPGLDTDGEAAPGGTERGAVVATDARLRAIRLIAEALMPVAQKKALLYFTAGLGNGAQDTPAELRAATTAASRANLAIYPVDTRGLRAVVPSGAARIGSRAGEGLFSGRDVNDQFDELTTSQDTMASMATATGGRLFSGSNDVSDAFARAQRDTAAYYLVGYSSSNSRRDGRFRRVQVRVKREGLRVEARAGYYAERDFAHMSRADREAHLEERLSAPAEASDLGIGLTTAWFRVAADRVRIAIQVSADALPRATGETRQIDLLISIRDEQERPVGRVRDTIAVASRTATGFVYTSSVELPPGRFMIHAVVRENDQGRAGTVHSEIAVPEQALQSLSASAPLLQAGSDGGRTLYVEIYDAPAQTGAGAPLVVSAAFFRDSIKVFAADLHKAAMVSDGRNGTLAYELPLVAGSLEPGRYLCQITVVDPVGGRFSVSRAETVLR